MCKQMCSEKIINLAKAMITVQKVIRPACKDKMNSFTQSRYATLNSVMEACSEVLINAGIWVTQYPVPVDGNGSQLGLVTKLVHAESGEWQESLIVMLLAKADPQAYGSALTYARRYELSVMVGLLAKDDDENMACQGSIAGARNHKKRTSLMIPLKIMFQEIYLISTESLTSKTQDGALYITATGNTRNKNGILKEVGFKWHSSRKLWWKAA